MATGTAYVPPALPTSVVLSGTTTVARNTPYLSPTQYRLAPTAVATTGLVPKSANVEVDSLQALYDVINRASSWADDLCFHRADGTLAASPTTETLLVKIKADGTVMLPCNFKPVLEITGLALGSAPSQLSTIDVNTAADTWVEGKVIMVPYYWSTGPTTNFPRPAAAGGRIYAAWTYINGYPHNYLTASCSKNDTSLKLASAVNIGGLCGIYPGTPLNIIDGNVSETVTVTGLPSGNTVPCSPLAFAHTPPTAPDFIPVTALTKAIEQAAIFLTNVLIKTRGSRALIMAGAPGGTPSRAAMSQAGAIDDYEFAKRLLHPYTTVVLH